MSKKVSVVPANNEVPAVDFSYKSLSWKVDFECMRAADNKGRMWFVKEDGGQLVLQFEECLQATITCDDVKASFAKHRGRFLKKWIGTTLID
jgi:hypothetical protein